MVIFGITLVTLVAIIVLARYEGRFYITEYLFFIRYPILLGIVLVALPYAGPAVAPESLTNIFVLDVWGVGVVSFIACFAAWTIVHTARLIWVSIPAKCHLALDRTVKWEDVQEAPEDGIVLTHRYHLLSTGLALPVILSCVALADPPGKRSAAAMSAVVGALVAAGAWLVGQTMVKGLEVRGARQQRTLLSAIESHAPQRWQAVLPYHGMPLSIQRLHLRALGVFAATVLLYVGIGVLAQPSWPLSDHVPALAYVLILLMMLMWVLGAISFLFDRSRVPGVSLLVLLLILAQSIFPSTHYYQVTEWKGGEIPMAYEAMAERWDAKDQGPMVAVAASGGGITASLWTAIVLEGLHKEIPGFGDRVALLSSVSGGGIATMMYADSFSSKGAPCADRLKQIVEASGTSSLDAATWGMAYPDLWRFIIGKWNRFSDRGQAIENRWAKFLREKDSGFSDWVEGVKDGWRPLQVFNVSVQESGGRLLLAAADLKEPKESPDRPRMKQDLVAAFPGGDVKLATAARLSATFPYVAPQAKAEEGRFTKKPSLHCADGGYFDVSGMYTTMEVLSTYLNWESASWPPVEDREERRIAIIEIRAADAADAAENAKRSAARGGLVNAMAGPISTLYNSRISTQIVRNAVEFNLMQEVWQPENVNIQKFVFHLTDRMPLSWNLTEAERNLIHAHWPGPLPTGVKSTDELEDARKYNLDQLERLKTFLLKPAERLPAAPRDPAQMKY